MSDFPAEKPETTEKYQQNHGIIMQLRIENLDILGFQNLFALFLEVFGKLFAKDHLSSDAKGLIAKNRQAFRDSILKEEYKKKSEEMMKKKLEEKKKESASIASLSPEAQRKHDEKEYKKQLKKKMKAKVVKA